MHGSILRLTINKQFECYIVNLKNNNSLMYKQLIIILIVLFSWSDLFSQRLYSNEFMSIGVGARSLALSNSVIASTNDVTASYYNPAGLVLQQNKLSLGVMHSEYFAGILNYDYIGGSYKIDNNRSVGVSLLRFGVDDIQNTTELKDSNGEIDLQLIKKFSVADYGLLLSFGQNSKITNLRYGVNVKIIHSIVGEFANAWGFGFDAGFQYDKDNWKFGGVLRDATSTFNAWSFNTEELEITILDSTFNTISENEIEITLPKLLLGVARSFEINNDFNLLAEINLDFSFDGQKHTVISNKTFSIDPHLGLELDYKKLIYFRSGLGNIQESTSFDGDYWSFQPNIGIGIRIKHFAIDYALTDIGDQSIAEYSNIFSLRYFLL